MSQNSPGLNLLCLITLATSSFATVPPARNFVLTDSVVANTVFDPIHKVVYASVPGLNQVDVISTSQHAIVARISVPSAYSMDLSPDGSQLVVGGGGGGYTSPFLTLIDTSTLQVVNRIPVPMVGSFSYLDVPLSLAWTSNGTVLIVVYQSGTTGSGLVQWDPSQNSFRPRTLPGAIVFPQGLTRSADRSKVLIFDASTSGSNLVLYDASIDDFSATGSAPGYFVAANGTGTQFVSQGVNQLSFMDSSLNVTATLWINSYGGKPLFSSDGKSLYSSEGNAYTVYDTTTFMPVGQVPAFYALYGPANLDGTDDLNEFFGAADRGVIFNGFPAVSGFPALFGIGSLSSDTGTLSSPTAVTATGQGFANGDALYFGGSGAALTINSSTQITASPPPSTNPGPVDLVLTNPGGGAVLSPQAYSYGPTILYVQSNAGPSSGGTPFLIIGYGFNFSNSQINLTVGGSAATITQVFPYPGVSPFALPIQQIYANTSPGTTGAADITLTTPMGTATVHNGFYYYPVSAPVGPTSTGQMVFDHNRQVLYASDDSLNRVDVISPTTNSVVGSLPSGSGPLGIAESPDGSTLVVANWSSQSVSIINIAAATQTQTILNQNGQGPGSLYPTAVAVANNGKALVAATDINLLDNGDLFELDLASGKLTLLSIGPIATIGGLYLTSDIELHAFQNGSKIWIGSGDRGGSDSMGAVIWDTASGTFTNYPVGPFPESDITGDGLVTAAGSAFYDPEGQLYSFAAPLDLITYQSIVFGVRLHPGGGLFFRPYAHGQPNFSAVGLFDVNTGSLLRQIVLAGNAGSSFDTMAVDDTGNRVFFSTDSGIVTVNVSPLPVSIGSLNPNQGLTAGGDTITIRGSGFQPGAVASFGTIAANTTFVDQNTLQAVTPPSAAGPVQVQVKNMNGSVYALPAGFSFVNSIPAILSTSPNSATAGAGLALTVYGSSFDPNSIIRWNGGAQSTTYLDDSTLQATIASSTVGTAAGTAKLTIANPSGAVSSPFLLPVALPPGQLTLNGMNSLDFGPQLVGSSSSPLTVVVANSGSGQLSSVAQSVTGSFTSTTNCPSSMTPNSTCDVFVTFHPPATGVFVGTLNVTSNFGSQTVSLTGRGTPSGTALSSSVYSADFGTSIIGAGLAQYQINIYSVGSSPAVISSVDLTGAYQLTQNTCQANLAVGSWCYVFLTFTPSAPGTQTGTLSVASNASDSPLVVPLTGVAVQPVTLTPTSLTFGQQLVGATPATQQITVQNNGSAISAITGVNSPPDFNAVSNCPQNVYPGQTCTITVSFAPGLAGNDSETFSLWETTGNLRGLVNYPLSGTAVNFQFFAPQGSVTSATINPGQTASYSLSLNDQGYSGNVNFTCTGAPSLSTCSVSPAPDSISGNVSQTITVSVQTTAPTSNSAAGVLISANRIALHFGFVMAGLFLVPLRRFRWRKRLGVVATITALLLITSCGGGANSSPGGGGGGGGKPGTPAGTYTLVVAGTSGGVTQQLNLTLTVN